jgi:hypothetical protein
MKRREFLKQGSALGASVAAASLVVSGSAASAQEDGER